MSRLSSKAINEFLNENFEGELSANVAASTTSELVQIMTDAGIPPGQPDNDQVLLSDMRDVIIELASTSAYLTRRARASHWRLTPLNRDNIRTAYQRCPTSLGENLTSTTLKAGLI